LSKKRDSAGSSPADSGIQGSSWLLSTRFAKVLSIFERQREARDETSLLNEQVSHKRNEANDLDPKDFQEDPLSGDFDGTSEIVKSIDIQPRFPILLLPSCNSETKHCN
jgi:hypothetical protein